ncbi:MAG: RNA methyltransferase [Geobacteraceae bacterium]|nr:RNA methyltransferase [Geobacteraceae bacterium]
METKAYLSTGSKMNELNLRDRISIILVEPQSPGNVGMVCRAMKNMGLNNLRLVKGCRTDHSDARRMAVAARDLLDAAVRCDSLEQALADVEISIATTRRLGKYRQETMNPDKLVSRLRSRIGNGRAAFVFGREDNGLTTHELSLCRWQATIPASDEYGSLNLAQAVLVFCYELTRGIRDSAVTPANARELSDTQEMEALFSHMEKTLLGIGFLDPANPAHLMRTLRRILSRAELDSREVAVLRGIMSQVDWATDRMCEKEPT